MQFLHGRELWPLQKKRALFWKHFEELQVSMCCHWGLGCEFVIGDCHVQHDEHVDMHFLILEGTCWFFLHAGVAVDRGLHEHDVA